MLSLPAYQLLVRSAYAMSTKRALRSSTSAHVVTAGHDGAIPTGKCNSTTRGTKRKSEHGTSTMLSKRTRTPTPTPTPKIVEEKSEGASTDPSLARPAEPRRTNAPLITPRGSRVVTYPKESLDLTPRAGIPRPTTTTAHILDQACAHLIEMEPNLKPLIEKHYCRVFSPEGLAEECDPFKSLCSGIMGQQVSGAAAASIKRKFIALFHSPDTEETGKSAPFPTPAQVAPCTVPFLRQAGLSERKAEYIKGLAEKFVNGELSAAMLIDTSDEEVLEKLIAVRGLGL